MNEATSGYCVGCGRPVEPSWAFCPVCGAARVGEPALVAGARPPATLSTEVARLLDAGELAQAEAALASPRPTDRLELQRLLLLVELRQRQHRYMDMEPLLSEAVTLAPQDPVVRIRRAEYFARLGLLPKAQAEMALARRWLPATDLPLQLHCQELDHWLRERSKGSFVRQSTLPQMPGWLAGLFKHHPSPSSESR